MLMANYRWWKYLLLWYNFCIIMHYWVKIWPIYTTFLDIFSISIAGAKKIQFILKQYAHNSASGSFKQLDGVFHLSKQKSECDNIPKWVSWQTLFNLVEENFAWSHKIFWRIPFLFFFWTLKEKYCTSIANSSSSSRPEEVGYTSITNEMDSQIDLRNLKWKKDYNTILYLPPLYKLVVISMLQTYTLVGVIGIWTPYPVKI